MRRTAPMVLVLGILLSGGVLAAGEQAKADKPTHKPNKSTPRSGKPTPAAPAASAAKANHVPAAAKTHPVAAHGIASQRTERVHAATSTAALRASAHEADARQSGAHEAAHRVAPGPSRGRATNGRDGSSQSAIAGAGNARFGRRKVQARAAVLTSRRLRDSLRNRDSELPITRAPATEVVSLHRRALGLPAPLRGSFASLERQDEISEGEDGLERIQDEDDLQDRIAHNFLVPVPTSADLTVNQKLPESHRYCRPWTARFLTDLARLHAVRFHSSLEVSSAVRTVDYQKKLQLTNGNATAAEGDVASPHLTGAAIDIPKSNMTRDEIAWMRTSLLALEQAGKLDVEEEFRQSCFHITVYKSYAAQTPAAAPLAEVVDTADGPASPDGRSVAPANVPASSQTTGRTHAAARRSRRAIARPARALPA